MSRPSAPSTTSMTISRPMFRSSSAPIVRAAFSDTFEVSAESTRRRSTGSPTLRRSSAVSLTAVTERRESTAAPVAVRSRASLRSWASWARTVAPLARGSGVSSSSPSTAGATPPWSSASALWASSLPVCVGFAWAPARASKTSWTYRSARVRWRAATSRTDARCCEPEVAQIETVTVSVENNAKVARIPAIVRRPRVANGLNA